MFIHLALMKQQNVILRLVPEIGYIDRMGNDELKWNNYKFDFKWKALSLSQLNMRFDNYIKNTKDLLLDVEFLIHRGLRMDL